eukprot:scaffold2151_cov99-Isochrysis_galbana.AAC.12
MRRVKVSASASSRATRMACWTSAARVRGPSSAAELTRWARPDATSSSLRSAATHAKAARASASPLLPGRAATAFRMGCSPPSVRSAAASAGSSVSTAPSNSASAASVSAALAAPLEEALEAPSRRAWAHSIAARLELAACASRSFFRPAGSAASRCACSITSSSAAGRGTSLIEPCTAGEARRAMASATFPAAAMARA